MRTILSVLAGSLAAIAGYVAGAAAALLIMRGIPLGSAGGPPTPAELAVHLILAVTVTLLGSLLAISLSGASSPRLHAGAVGVLLAIGALIGFTKPTSQWPPWFGFAMAIACLVGATSAAVWRRGA